MEYVSASLTGLERLGRSSNRRLIMMECCLDELHQPQVAQATISARLVYNRKLGRSLARKLAGIAAKDSRWTDELRRSSLFGCVEAADPLLSALPRSGLVS